jgi:hypothetical protein
MIQKKFYTEKEGRDPNIYLGIDESHIPIEYVKGIFSDAGNVYTDDPLWGEVQFIVTEDEKSLILVTTNPNSYVTKEDLQSTDVWHKIGFAFPEYQEFTNWRSIQESFDLTPLGILLKRYKAGETGLLEYEEKKFNDKGEYMRIYRSFDTRPHPTTPDVRDTLRRHINFVYADEPTTMWQDREMIVKSNTNNIMELLNLEVKPQIDTLAANGLLKVSEDQENKIQFIMVPSMGKLQLEFDETIEDFFVTKIDK